MTQTRTRAHGRWIALLLILAVTLGLLVTPNAHKAYAAGSMEAMTVRELLDKIEAKDSFAVVFGFEACPSCQAAMPILQYEAQAAGRSVGYIDTRANPAWTSNMDIDDYEELTAALGQYFALDADGQQHLYVPHVFFIKAGEVALQHQGLADGAEPETMTAAQQAALAAIYRRGFESIKSLSEDEFIEELTPSARSSGCADCGTRSAGLMATPGTPPWSDFPADIWDYANSADAKKGTVTGFTYNTALYDYNGQYGANGMPLRPPQTATATVYLPHGYGTAEGKKAYNLLVVFGGDLDASTSFISDTISEGLSGHSITGSEVYDYVFAKGHAEPFIIIQLSLTGWYDNYDEPGEETYGRRARAAAKDVQTAIDYANANYKTYAAYAAGLSAEKLAECACVGVGHYSYAGHSRGAVFVPYIEPNVEDIDWTLRNYQNADWPAVEWRHNGSMIASTTDAMHSDGKFLLAMANALQLFDDACDCPDDGEAYVLKASGNPELTNGNNCYSLAGAVYKVFSSRADAVAGRNPVGEPWVTDASGKSSPVKLAAGTYWLLETTAPRGFALNPNPVQFTVVSGETAEVRVTDAPKSDPVGVLLQKVPVDQNGRATRG